MGGSTHCCWVQKNQTVVLVYIQKEYTHYFSLLRTLSWSWWDPGVSTLPHVPVPSVALTGQSVNKFVPGLVFWLLGWTGTHTFLLASWPLISLVLGPQTWLSFTDTWSVVDFLRKKCYGHDIGEKWEEMEEQAEMEEPREAIEMGEVRGKSEPRAGGWNESKRLGTRPRHPKQGRGDFFRQCRIWNKIDSSTTYQIHDLEILIWTSYGNTWSKGDTLWEERRISAI